MPYRIKPPTKEEVEEIRKENKRKLDEILSIPNYQVYLGKKYYGERYHTILEDNHYLKKEHRKRVQSFGSDYKSYIERPIIQMDLDGKFIKKWNNAKEWAESEGRKTSAASHVSKCAQGHVMSQKQSSYGYLWKFVIDDEYDYKNHKSC